MSRTVRLDAAARCVVHELPASGTGLTSTCVHCGRSPDESRARELPRLATWPPSGWSAEARAVVTARLESAR